MTELERLAALETHQRAHLREHTYIERAWEGHLDAINARLRNIESALLGWRGDGNGAIPLNGANGRRRVSGRDVGLAGGSATIATATWWLVELLRRVVGG